MGLEEAGQIVMKACPVQLCVVHGVVRDQPTEISGGRLD